MRGNRTTSICSATLVGPTEHHWRRVLGTGWTEHPARVVEGTTSFNPRNEGGASAT